MPSPRSRNNNHKNNYKCLLSRLLLHRLQLLLLVPPHPKCLTPCPKRFRLKVSRILIIPCRRATLLHPRHHNLRRFKNFRRLISFRDDMVRLAEKVSRHNHNRSRRHFSGTMHPDLRLRLVLLLPQASIPNPEARMRHHRNNSNNNNNPSGHLARCTVATHNHRWGRAGQQHQRLQFLPTLCR